MGQSSFCLDFYLFLWYHIGDIWADIFLFGPSRIIKNERGDEKLQKY